MMLRQTPQMLKKSGIKKGDAMNYLAFIVRIVHVCVETEQRAEKRRDAIGGKEGEPALIVVGRMNTQRSGPYPSATDSPIPNNIFSYFKLIPVYFCLF